jgi:hypothetical protein
MTTEDEALKATREGLAAAGVALDKDGRVKPVSSFLADIAKEGGGVLDADTATEYSIRIEAGEAALLYIARTLVDTGSVAKAAPSIATLAWSAFQAGAIKQLSRAIPQFIYGLSTQAVADAAAPLMDLRKAEQAAADAEPLGDSFDTPGAPQ